MPRTTTLPETKLDPAMVRLSREVNRLPGIATSESCQGFIDGHRPEEPWSVHFGPTGTPSVKAYASLEFLVWFVHPARHAGFNLSVAVNSPPPYLNGPGESMYFVLECKNKHPDELADLLHNLVTDLFFLP